MSTMFFTCLQICCQEWPSKFIPLWKNCQKKIGKGGLVSEKPFLKFSNILCYQKRRFYHHESQKAVPDDIVNFYKVFTEEIVLLCMCLLFCAGSQSLEGWWCALGLFSCSSFTSLVFENRFLSRSHRANASLWMKPSYHLWNTQIFYVSI